MLPQELAVQKICSSLKNDPHVRAIFLKEFFDGTK